MTLEEAGTTTRPGPFFARRVEGEVVQAPARKDRLPRGRVDPIDLEGMEHGVRTNLDEGVTAAWWILLCPIEGHPRVEDALVEGDQPVHVAGQKGHMVQVVEQRHRLLLDGDWLGSRICGA